MVCDMNNKFNVFIPNSSVPMCSDWYIFAGENSKASRYPLWEYSDQKTPTWCHEQGANDDDDDGDFDDPVMLVKDEDDVNLNLNGDDNDNDGGGLDGDDDGRWILGTAWPTARRRMLLISELSQVRHHH